jgi:hypothetical protein
MSRHLGTALRRGAGQLFSRTGAVVLAACLATMLVYQLSFNTLVQPAVAGMAPPGAGPPATTTGLVTLPASGVVAGGLLVYSLLVASVLAVVAVHTTARASGPPSRAGSSPNGYCS